ncbi:50S ribosomal protein L24 [Vallicoccus soli]|uniref:Large ribosomal subunit protein uL24 n=1 Tax=Vallicoccus soli TaxID=2339232 RepID=A0A3A3YS90_9ACTN|nr:50S ribosomal protein L24 [Vallicoccus soli]RJK93506.1 50S ribosomal protein L24 [Vallicoccus soli]
MHVRKGDLVEVISGKDKGLQGKVIAAYPDREKVLVEGVNRIKKHTKAGQGAGGGAGGIVTQEAPVHVSNVMLVDPSDGKRTRVGTRVDENGQKVRVSKRTGKDI